jgi:hypothetical protein
VRAPVWLIAFVALATAASACANTPTSPHAASARGAPLALPPAQPCAAPDAAELQTLEQASDFVVEATVSPNSWIPLPGGNGSAYQTPLSNVTVLASKASEQVPHPLVLADETDPASYRPPGTYIFFLANDAPSQLYYPVNGLAGAFRISGQAVIRTCANYGGAAPLAASATALGSVTTLSAMKSAIPSVLPPSLLQQRTASVASTSPATPSP